MKYKGQVQTDKRFKFLYIKYFVHLVAVQERSMNKSCCAEQGTGAGPSDNLL